MKSSAGYDQPRRPASGRRPVRLDLRPTKRRPSPEEEIARAQKSSFWMWFALVALFHLVLIVCLALFFRAKMTPPPEPFISLMPNGDTVKGTPGAQKAPKVGPTTTAPTVVHHTASAAPPTPPAPEPPPQPAVVQPMPQPILHPEMIAPGPAHVVQNKRKPAKPVPPKPKVKVDLHLVERPVADVADTPPAPTPAKPKPKHPVKKPVAKDVLGDDADIDRAMADPENRGLSRAEIAAKLGDKLDAEGVAHADKIGPSGVANAQSSPFQDFYNSIREQITDKWQVPNQDDAQATDPVVQIHVEKDGRVPPESVVLLHSSGNQAIDDSALAAARSMGYTLEPLPDGCPPDISINLQLNH
jgi:TonB family protein